MANLLFAICYLLFQERASGELLLFLPQGPIPPKSLGRVKRLSLLILFLCCWQPVFAANHLDPSVRQIIVGIASDWNSMTGEMQLLQKNGETWTKASPPIRVLFGKNGLAWEIGRAHV